MDIAIICFMSVLPDKVFSLNLMVLQALCNVFDVFCTQLKNGNIP